MWENNVCSLMRTFTRVCMTNMMERYVPAFYLQTKPRSYIREWIFCPLMHIETFLQKKNVPKTFLSYFEKKIHMSVVWAYVSLWLCGFVALCVRISVAGANKVEGTMGWCVETGQHFLTSVERHLDNLWSLHNVVYLSFWIRVKQCVL